MLRTVWHVCALVRAVRWLDRNASARVNVCARALEQHVSIETAGNSNKLAALRRGSRRKGKHLTRAFLILFLQGKPHSHRLMDSDMHACKQRETCSILLPLNKKKSVFKKPRRNQTGCCRCKDVRYAKAQEWSCGAPLRFNPPECNRP